MFSLRHSLGSFVFKRFHSIIKIVKPKIGHLAAGHPLLLPLGPPGWASHPALAQDPGVRLWGVHPSGGPRLRSPRGLQGDAHIHVEVPSLQGLGCCPTRSSCGLCWLDQPGASIRWPPVWKTACKGSALPGRVWEGRENSPYPLPHQSCSGYPVIWEKLVCPRPLASTPPPHLEGPPLHAQPPSSPAPACVRRKTF